MAKCDRCYEPSESAKAAARFVASFLVAVLRVVESVLQLVFRFLVSLL